MQSTKAVEISEFLPLSSDPKKEIVTYTEEEREFMKNTAIERLSLLQKLQ